MLCCSGHQLGNSAQEELFSIMSYWHKTSCEINKRVASITLAYVITEINPKYFNAYYEDVAKYQWVFLSEQWI